MKMTAKELKLEALTEPEILSLLEIARGFMAALPDWSCLRRRIARSEAWWLLRGDTLVGFALMKCPSAYADCAAELTELHYRWECGDERSILDMLETLARPYRGRSRYLLLDVNRRHEINLELYRRFGFRDCAMRSSRGGDNIILLADLTVQ